MKDLILIGKISKPHGIKGFVKIRMLADVDILENLDTIYLKSAQSSFTPIVIDRVTPQNDRAIIHIQGVDDRNAAAELAGSEIHIPRDALKKLPQGEYYHFELIGLDVKTDSGALIGSVTEILSTGANDVYVVTTAHKEVMIPAIKEVVKKIDIDHKEMIITPMEGLLD